MKETTLSREVAGRVADRLTILLGLAGLLKDGAFGSVTERQRQALQEMLQTSEEMGILLRPLFLQQESSRP